MRLGHARLALLLPVALGACKDEQTMIPGVADRLLDPATCEECHPDHHKEWGGSMHAYASADPIFTAMNERGQRETGGALGEFCIKCHAPLAVELGLTTDGLNLDEVPEHLQGVTCYYCHTVKAVEGTHNNPLKLSHKGTLLGAIHDPVDNDVHDSKYSPYLDSNTLQSADLCGSCHDIVNGHGVHLERTFAEWQASFMADTDPMSGGPAPYGLRCPSCHMGPAMLGTVADFDGVRADRFKHPHLMVGVDTALTKWPEKKAQKDLIDFQRKSSLCATVCVNPDPDEPGSSIVDVWLHNEFTAHAWPSGAVQDRRAWLELHISGGGKEVLSSGVVADGQALNEIEGSDPLLWQFRDRIYGKNGEEVHMFWEAQSNESALMPASAILSPQGDASTWRARRYRIPDVEVDSVTTTLHLRPLGLDVIDSLIASGDLDASMRDKIPTFDAHPTVLDWTPSATVYEGYGVCFNSGDDLPTGGSCGAPVVGACTAEEFYCKADANAAAPTPKEKHDAACIPAAAKCDGTPDCSDGEDESDC